MTSTSITTTNTLKAVAKASENICSLPAVATQDWCDRAAMAVLALAQPAVAVSMIGQIDDRGGIVRQEATGIAGVYLADVTTSVGRQQTSSSAISMDPSDANLAQVRTNLAQTKELHWTPGHLAPSATRAGTADKFGINILDTSNPVVRRWSGYRVQGLLLGAAAIGPGGRVLIVEVASSHAPLGEQDAAALEAVMPLLARRAIMAIGTDPSEAAAWLTTREQAILRHLLLGKSVREIAEELGRSPHTVHDHVKSLHRKLGASSRGELVARALGHSETPSDAGEKPAPARKPQIHVRPMRSSGQTA